MLSCEKNRDESLKVFSLDLTANYALPLTLPAIRASNLSLNPLSPNSDQHQFSPNDIHRLSRAKFMRINKMITKRKIFDLLSNSLN